MFKLLAFKIKDKNRTFNKLNKHYQLHFTLISWPIKMEKQMRKEGTEDR